MPRLDGDVVVRDGLRAGGRPAAAVAWQSAATGGIQAEGGRERWTANPATEASEQCRRLWLPELGEAVQAQEWLAQPWPGRWPDPPPRVGRSCRLCELPGPMGRPAPSARRCVPPGRKVQSARRGLEPRMKRSGPSRGWQAVTGPRILRTSHRSRSPDWAIKIQKKKNQRVESGRWAAEFSR